MKPKINQLKDNRKIITVCSEIHFFHGSTALVGWDIPIADISRSNAEKPHSVGLLWTSDRPVTETSTWQHTTLTTDRHPCPPTGIRNRNPSNRAVADPHLIPRGHWDRLWDPHTKYINHCVDTARDSLMLNLVVDEVTSGLWSNMAFTIDTRHFQEKFDLM